MEAREILRKLVPLSLLIKSQQPLEEWKILGRSRQEIYTMGVQDRERFGIQIEVNPETGERAREVLRRKFNVFSDSTEADSGGRILGHTKGVRRNREGRLRVTSVYIDSGQGHSTIFTRIEGFRPFGDLLYRLLYAF